MNNPYQNQPQRQQPNDPRYGSPSYQQHPATNVSPHQSRNSYQGNVVPSNQYPMNIPNTAPQVSPNPHVH